MDHQSVFVNISVNRHFSIIPLGVAMLLLMLAALPIYAQGPATETTIITATNGAANDYFGVAVDVDDGTAVVGAHRANASQGAAYLFERNTGGAEAWGQVMTLTGHVANGWFGSAVAIDGDTLAVGASQVAPDGAVYIYDRNMGGADNWGGVITLTVTGSGAGDDFGSAVALDGDTLAVGALDGQSAYVFERNYGGADSWGLVTTLTVTATGVVTPGGFGYSVAIAGDTIVVGAITSKVNANASQGAAYVFTRNQGGADNWGVTAILTDTFGHTLDRFGHTVAIDHDRIVVTSIDAQSGKGLAILFERNVGGIADSWRGVKTWLGTNSGDSFGTGVTISGDTIVIGAPSENSSQGASYMYRRNHGGANAWGLDTKLTASDGLASDRFGNAVALDVTNNTFLIGAVSWNTNQGKAYIFNNTGNFWKEMADPVAQGGAAAEYFGGAVDISGGVLLAGAAYADNAGGIVESGEAYIFERNRSGKDGWGQVITLTHSGAATGDHLGSAVALDNDTALVGAPDENTGGTDAGSAYIFERNQGGTDNWGQVAELTASDGAHTDHFGIAVALDDDTALVGAWQHDVGGNSSQGAAYIFERNQGGVDVWGQVVELFDASGAANDALGYSVALSGDTAIVGAYRADPGGIAEQGEAYIFERNQGGADNWGQVITLTQGGDSGEFGYSVAIDGDIAAVTAPKAMPDGTTQTGAVYVFGRNQGGADNWGLITTLAPSILKASDWVNAIVSISGDTLVVSSRYAGTNGAAFVFDRNEGGTDNWGLSGVWESSDATAALFGVNSAIDANTIAVGDTYADVGGNLDQGRAYVYQLVVTPDLSISKSVTPTTAYPGDTITYTLTYSNNGLIPAFGVVITDDVPISVTNISYSSSGATITPTGTISYAWNVADLNVGDGGVITITGVMSNGLPVQTFTNTAQIDAANEGWQTDNTASALLSVGDVTVQGLTLTSDSPALTGETVHFTATITNGYNVSYAWDFGEGPDTATGATASYIYSVAGTYTAIVTASNAVSSQVATTTVVITDEPVAGLTVTRSSPVALGVDPNLQASITAGSNVRYDWDFGNGDTCLNCGTATPVMGSDYNYAAVGTYTVVVTASNAVNSLTDSITIEVTPAYNAFIYLPLVLK